MGEEKMKENTLTLSSRHKSTMGENHREKLRQLAKHYINIDPPEEWLAGQTIGRILGYGTFGVVCAILDRAGKETDEVIKIIDFWEYLMIYRPSSEQEGWEKIQKEKKLMDSFAGYNCVINFWDKPYRYYNDNGENESIYIIKMERLKPLEDWIPSVKDIENTVIEIGIQLCTCLIELEARGEVHRDIKIENIFVDLKGKEPVFKLGDFGIAKQVHTIYGTIAAGSIVTMAPEVYDEGKATTKSDQYSLASTMYALLNRNLYYTCKELKKDIEIKGTWEEPLNGSKQLKNIIKKAMSYNPEDRYDKAQTFQEELRNLQRRPVVNGKDSTKNIERSKNKVVTNKKKGRLKYVAIIFIVLFVAVFWKFNADAQSNYQIAEDLQAEQKYDEAIQYYEKIPFFSTVHTNAERKIEECSADYIEKLKEEVNNYLIEKDYETANTAIEKAQSILGDNSDLSELSSAVNEQYKEQRLQNSIAEAQGLADSGEYLEAYNLITDLLTDYTNNEELHTKQTEYIQKYKENLFSEADRIYTESGYEAAVNFLQESLANYEDDEINEKINYYEEKKPINLLTKEPFEGEMDKFLISYGDAIDNVGNSYQYKLSCGDIIKLAYYVKYALDGEYSTLEFDLGLNSEYKSAEQEFWVEIYDENGLIFETAHLGAGDRPEHYTVDISGVNDLAIQAWKSGQELKGEGPLLTNGFWVSK
ncbi:protein kinase domain-containing protein [Faecalicatena fissicatena]|nr:protein kinase [Faecalicatena fissicatena]